MAASSPWFFTVSPPFWYDHIMESIDLLIPLSSITTRRTSSGAGTTGSSPNVGRTSSPTALKSTSSKSTPGTTTGSRTISVLSKGSSQTRKHGWTDTTTRRGWICTSFTSLRSRREHTLLLQLIGLLCGVGRIGEMRLLLTMCLVHPITILGYVLPYFHLFHTCLRRRGFCNF